MCYSSNFCGIPEVLLVDFRNRSQNRSKRFDFWPSPQLVWSRVGVGVSKEHTSDTSATEVKRKLYLNGKGASSKIFVAESHANQAESPNIPGECSLI